MNGIPLVSSIEDLQLRAGQEPTAEDLRRLEMRVAQNAALPSLNVFTTVLPFGTIRSYDGGGGSAEVSPIFRPTVRRTGDGFAASWERGLIAGVEPTISGAPISGDADGIPELAIGTDAFDEAGEAKVYFKASLDGFWTVTGVEMVALAESPKGAAWTAYKLAAIVYADGGAPWRAVYANQGLLSWNRKGNGFANHLWHALF